MPMGAAIPMPIFAPVAKPPELDSADDVGVSIASVGSAAELEAAWGGLVEAEVEEKIEEDVDVDEGDEVEEAKFVSPLARSTAENGNGWRLLVSPEPQQSP